MILVTVGTQLPFPRLVSEMNRLAPDLGEEIIAQVGPDSAPYPNLEIRADLPPDAFEAEVARARVIVAHAGIGSILTARRHGRPLIMVPRQHGQGEHRNDHQMATAREMASRPGLHIAWEVGDLEELLRQPDLTPCTDAPGPELDALTGFITDWLSTP